jgi:hypothetical protein
MIFFSFVRFFGGVFRAGDFQLPSSSDFDDIAFGAGERLRADIHSSAAADLLHVSAAERLRAVATQLFPDRGPPRRRTNIVQSLSIRLNFQLERTIIYGTLTKSCCHKSSEPKWIIIIASGGKRLKQTTSIRS